jgi:hypothetical protein
MPEASGNSRLANLYTQQASEDNTQYAALIHLKPSQSQLTQSRLTGGGAHHRKQGLSERNRATAGQQPTLQSTPPRKRNRAAVS